MNVIQPCSDLSDAVALFPPHGLYLKPLARMNISVQLPTLKMPGKTISNGEVMEKLKYWTIPDEFTSIKVSKNTLEFIRFEAEIESRAKLSAVLARLDGRFIKLSKFSESLKVRAAEAKPDFPTRHTWDSYFRDAKHMNEMRPGERPDTLHLTNLPCRWFASKSDPSKPSEYILRKVFESFGEVRCVDIPAVDPYRNQMKAHIAGIKMFSYSQNVVFEGYVQFKEYVCFMKAMDALRGMKLVHKEDATKIFSASIKVDFDKTKHMSDATIKRRRVEREKLMAEDREQEEQDRIKAEKLEAEKEAERRSKQKEREDKVSRRRARENKRKMRQLEMMRTREADEMNRKIASEERLLVMAQRRLETIRLLGELLKRAEECAKKKLEEEGSGKHSKGRKDKAKGKMVSTSTRAEEDETMCKELELRQKLVKKLKAEKEKGSKVKGALASTSTSGIADSIVAGLATSSISSNTSSSGTSLSSISAGSIDKHLGSYKGLPQEAQFGRGFPQHAGDGGDPMAAGFGPGGGRGTWYPRGGNAAFNPYRGAPGFPGGGHRGSYFPRRRGFRWPRYQARGRGGGYAPPYMDQVFLDINHQYYKYFQKLTHGRASRSPSRSRSRSRSSWSSSYYSRSRSRSRNRSRSFSPRYRRSRRRSSRRRSRSSSRSRSRSRSGDSRRRRSRSRSRSPRRVGRSRSRSRRRGSHNSRSKSRSRPRRSRTHSSRSRSRRPKEKDAKSRSKSKSPKATRDDASAAKKGSQRRSRWDTVTVEQPTSTTVESEYDDHPNKPPKPSQPSPKAADKPEESSPSGNDRKQRQEEKDADATILRRSPIRFPSIAHTWSRSPSKARSLSWEKKQNAGQKATKDGKKNPKSSKKAKKSDKTKEKHKKKKK